MPVRNVLLLLIIMSAGLLTAQAGGFLPFGPGEGRSSFAVADFTLGYPVGPSDGPERKLDVSSELGWLFTLDEGLYLGPVFHFGSWLNGGWHSRWGLGVHTRIDLSSRLSLNLTPGLILGDSPFPDGFAGYTAGASVMQDGWVGLSADVDVTRNFNNDYDTVLRLGIDFGSIPGLCMTAAAGTAGAVASWLNSMD